MDGKIHELVEKTPLVDTHEHLPEEEARLAGTRNERYLPCNDWAYLFYHYLRSELLSAGMPQADQVRFYAPEVSSDEKLRLLSPWWDKVRNTGYAMSLRISLRDLYGVEKLDARGIGRLAEGYRDLVKPGFYRKILREKSNIECCHVNSMQRIFMETSLPDLLLQDLSFVALSSGGPDLGAVEQDSGRRADTLDGWLQVIDWYFSTYGPRAVAVKNQSAYARGLDYEVVPRALAEPLFARHARGEALAPHESKALQDFLFRYCVGKATELGLPVKLHTGYHAGSGYMRLSRVSRNAADLCPLLESFPDTRFVLMHIGYPYQDEFISLAKHYPNAYVDMCWAWIINPAAGVRFLKEALMAAPANKLFTFGGDYCSVETVYGHSRIARRGIAQALSELVEEGWVARDEVPPLVERIMRGNAHEVFPTRAVEATAARPAAR